MTQRGRLRTKLSALDEWVFGPSPNTDRISQLSNDWRLASTLFGRRRYNSPLTRAVGAAFLIVGIVLIEMGLVSAACIVGLAGIVALLVLTTRDARRRSHKP